MNPNPTLWGGPEQLEVAKPTVLDAIKLVLSHSDVAIVLLPHDYREWHHELGFCRFLIEQLSGSHRQRCTIINDIATASYVKSIVCRLDFVFSGRMHLAIAALGVHTPVSVVDYQGKIEGLAQHFGILPLVMMRTTYTDSERFAAHVIDCCSQRIVWRRKLSIVSARTQELAERNFRHVVLDVNG